MDQIAPARKPKLKCLVCPEETKGKSKFCSQRCRAAHWRGGLKNPAETYRRRAAAERRKAAKERSDEWAATVLAGAVTSKKILQKKQEAVRPKIEVEGRKIHGRKWQAPSHVLAAHLPAGVEVISAGGVTCYLVQLRPRVLVR